MSRMPLSGDIRSHRDSRLCDWHLSRMSRVTVIRHDYSWASGSWSRLARRNIGDARKNTPFKERRRYWAGETQGLYAVTGHSYPLTKASILYSFDQSHVSDARLPPWAFYVSLLLARQFLQSKRPVQYDINRQYPNSRRDWFRWTTHSSLMTMMVLIQAISNAIPLLFRHLESSVVLQTRAINHKILYNNDNNYCYQS